MRLTAFPFESTDWSQLPVAESPGTTGVARRRIRQFGEIRVRMVEYSPGYVADHWCEKGHFLVCLEGCLRTELADGRVFELTAGMSYQVGDGIDPHRSSTVTGARLFIVD